MLLSIIVINYNNRVGLEETCQSFSIEDFGFTQDKLEIIFVDGGSTDGSLEFLQDKVAQGSNSFKIISGPDAGIYDAFNKGLKNAKGKFIGFVNSGDSLSDKEILYDIIKCIEENENLDGIYGDGTVQSRFNSILRVRKPGKFKRWKVLFGWMPPHPLFCINRTAFKKLGNFDTTMTIAADYDLLLRFFYFNKLTTVYVPKVFVNMEPVSTSGGSFFKIIEANLQVLAAWRKYSILPPVWICVSKPISKIFEYRWLLKAKF